VRALLQRVTPATVGVGDEVVGRIGKGLCVFVGVARGDTAVGAERLAGRIWNLRIFEDAAGLTNLSAADLGVDVLVVSQFTLYADASKGRRPSFVRAAPPDEAEPLVDVVVRELRAAGARVATGRFGATMRVELVNDGPFTVLLETEREQPGRFLFGSRLSSGSPNSMAGSIDVESVDRRPWGAQRFLGARRDARRRRQQS